MAFKSIIGATCTCLALMSFNVSAAVIHTYEFGNTANGGLDSGTLVFSSEGVPASPSWIESDYGDFKGTINGNYYDFSNLTPPGGDWTQIASRYLYDFTSTNNAILFVASFEKDTSIFQYALRFKFDEPTGFGIGALTLRAGIISFPTDIIEDYGSQVGYLHTTSQIVPIPSAVWLFGSGLIGLVGLARRKANV